MLRAISPLDERELTMPWNNSLRRQSCRSRPAAMAAFTFKHALMEDAAYASLLRSKRQELHGRVAEALEHHYPERVRIEPEVVAHHYTHAGKGLQAAAHWIAAAQRALDRSANLETLGHANKGLEVLATATPSAESSRLELDLEILRGAAYRALRGCRASETDAA